MKEYEEKCIALRTSIEQLAVKDMVVAFSGGADSSLLLKLACEAAGRKRPEGICGYGSYQAPPGGRFGGRRADCQGDRGESQDSFCG